MMISKIIEAQVSLMMTHVSSPLIQILGMPPLFIAIGVYANRLGKRDGDITPKVVAGLVDSIRSKAKS